MEVKKEVKRDMKELITHLEHARKTMYADLDKVCVQHFFESFARLNETVNNYSEQDYISTINKFRHDLNRFISNLDGHYNRKWRKMKEVYNYEKQQLIMSSIDTTVTKKSTHMYKQTE